MMPTAARPISLPRAFVHPLWWSALGLLLLNDHVLKHAGVLPNAVTGKLSDFAGMLVAPPLLALVLGPRRASARWIASIALGLGLCAIKLFPQAAHALEQALACLHLRSHFCVDATDLWALSTLPLGHALCVVTPMPTPSRARRFAARARIALAAAACLATGGSSDNKGRDDSPFVINKTDKPLTLVIASTEGHGGCRIYRDDRIGALTEDAFTAPREITLEAGDDAQLPSDTSTNACGAASIALQDGEQTLVFWRELDKIESFVPKDDDARLARRLAITGKAGNLKFQPGDDLSEFELGQDAPEPTCPEPEASDSLAFIWLSMAQGFLTIGELRTADDGCLEVDWFEGGGDTSPETQRLCIPEWAFPFKQDETLSVVQSANDDGGRSLRVTRFDGTKLDTQLEIWNDTSEFNDSGIKELAAVDCVGQLSSCGAYVRPVEVTVRGSEDTLKVGGDAKFSGKDSTQTHVLIGTARDVAWTSGTCTGADARVGSSANALELRSY